MSVVTMGCKVNQYDGEALCGLLQRHGWSRVEEGPVELVILNTCTVTSRADADARRWIRRLRRANPHAKLVVTGCLAERDGELVAAMSEVDLVVGNSARARLPELIEDSPENTVRTVVRPSLRCSTMFSGPLPGPDVGRARAFLKIQEGCRQYCSYCIVPSVRGPMRSRSIAEVVREIQHLEAAGYPEIVLCGVHLGAFGRERGERLADLAAEADRLPGRFRLRLSSLEPWSVDDSLLGMIGVSEKIAPHLHLPLQSGCDATLRRMRRPYTAREYGLLVENARERIPDVTVGTDVMVGFPGEDDREFEETMAFLRSSPIDLVHVFPYSPRPGTAAFRWNAPPQRVAKERLHRVRKLFDDRRRDWLSRHVGRTVSVVTLAEDGGATRALSGTYAPVRIGRRLGRGRLLKAVVTAVDGSVLIGEGPDTGRSYNSGVQDDSASERTAVEGRYVGP